MLSLLLPMTGSHLIFFIKYFRKNILWLLFQNCVRGLIVSNGRQPVHL
jgi:hypothetical protein